MPALRMQMCFPGGFGLNSEMGTAHSADDTDNEALAEPTGFTPTGERASIHNLLNICVIRAIRGSQSIIQVWWSLTVAGVQHGGRGLLVKNFTRKRQRIFQFYLAKTLKGCILELHCPAQLRVQESGEPMPPTGPKNASRRNHEITRMKNNNQRRQALWHATTADRVFGTTLV